MAPPALLLLAALAAAPEAPVLAAPPELTTVAERSGFLRTGRYDEAVALCRAFPERFPGRARCDVFGTTPEGRELVALTVSADGVLDPAAARAAGRPVVLFQGGIHAGEIDGKDAGFWLLREALQGKGAAAALGKVTAVFVPVFNADGHERFGKNHRPNQAGPEEQGFRVTAQNLNLNRDYAKADAPEMAAMLRLLRAWDPILYLDLHVTDGAKFEHDVAVLIEPVNAGAEPLRVLGAKLRDALFARLTKQQHLPLAFYPSLVEEDRPASGFAIGFAPPRFSTSYWALKNRFGVLVETHSWKDYPTRVRTTRDVVEGFLELAARDGAVWRAAAKAADEAERTRAPAEVALAYDTTPRRRTIDFRGYAYTLETSELSGKPWVRYDDTRPQLWKVPLRDELRPSLIASVPRAGYVVPPAHAAWLGEKLALHGFSFVKLPVARAGVEVEAFRATEASYKQGTYEGRTILALKGGWQKERRDLAAGSLFVPVAQPGARLLVHLLDPSGPDSFLSWGFFNAAFEQKEYVEDYVLEADARAMLAKDPALRAQFEAKLAAEPAFAKDPAARLRFFYKRHPAYDERQNLYPVLRVDAVP